MDSTIVLNSLSTGAATAAPAQSQESENGGMGSRATGASAPVARGITITSLSRLLRAMGASVIIVAALTFLFQRWGLVDHITRYFSFLGFTLLLSAAGFLCGLKLREDKGARTFLAIAAALIPVNFCALGGLGYSRVLAHSGTVRDYYDAIRWVAPSDFAAYSTSLIALLLLTAVAFISFSALLRSEARRLTLVFILANSLLLLPTREANSSALLATLLFIGLVRFDLRVLRNAAGSITTEGRLCRVLMALPFVAFLGRTLNLYYFELTTLFVSSILAAAALFLFKYLPEYLESADAREYSQFLSCIPASAAWAVFITDANGLMQLQGIGELCLLTLPISLLLTLLSLWTSPRLGARFRKGAAMIAISSAAAGLVFFPGVGAAFLCVLISLLTASYGYFDQNRTTFITGMVGFGIGLLYHLRYALELYSYSPWVSMALLGTVTVIASSYIERNFKQITEQLRLLRTRIMKWE